MVVGALAVALVDVGALAVALESAHPQIGLDRAVASQDSCLGDVVLFQAEALAHARSHPGCVLGVASGSRRLPPDEAGQVPHGVVVAHGSAADEAVRA